MNDYNETIDRTAVCPKKEERTIKDMMRELERLQKSRFVAIAQQDIRVRAQLEAQLQELRALEKRGREIADADVDVQFLSQFIDVPDFGC